MERTTISLPPELLQRLRRAAAAEEKSMAALIREAGDEKLAEFRSTPRSLGIGAYGCSDTARRTADDRPEPRS